MARRRLTQRLALLGLAAFVGAACGGPATLESSLERDLVGTWQNPGCGTSIDAEPLRATCFTLELDPSRHYTKTGGSDAVEPADEGRWGVVAADDVSGQLHLEDDSVVPFRLRGDELVFFRQTLVRVASASGRLKSDHFATSLATLDAMVGQTWHRLGGPLDSPLAPRELTLDPNGTYSVAFDSGCEASGELWGYREEASPRRFYTGFESVLWLMGGCVDSFGNPRPVSVDLVDGRLFLNHLAYGSEVDSTTSHALGHRMNGVAVHATYAPPTDAGERLVLHLRVINDRTDTIEVSSVDINTSPFFVNEEQDGYSSSARSPDTTTRIGQTILPGGRSTFEVELSLPEEGVGAQVGAFVRFEADGHDRTAGVGTRLLFPTG